MLLSVKEKNLKLNEFTYISYSNTWRKKHGHIGRKNKIQKCQSGNHDN